MKRKITLLSLCFVAALGANAQNKKGSSKKDALKQAYEAPATSQNSISSNKTSSMAPLYSEDFASGIPATWTQGPSPAGALWEYRGPSTSPTNAVGSRGCYAGSGAPIASATTANGFVIFDSDYYDTGGAGCPGAIVGVPHVGRLYTPAFDLSSYSFVEMRLTSYLRQYSSGMYVLISTDSTNWNDTLDIGGSTALNSASANARTDSYDISAAAGGQSKVYFQFVFDGESNVNGSSFGPGYYFWMFDDFSISALPGNDIQMQARYIVAETNLDTYTKIPLQHVDKISLQADVKNYGFNDQPNTIFSAKINDGSTDVFTYSNGAGYTMPYGADTTFASGYYTPTSLGNYTTSFSVSSDSTDVNSSDNSLSSIDFEITDSTYARDNGNTATASSLGTNSFTTSGSDQDGFAMLNLFEFTGEDTISSISFQFVNSGSNFASGAIIRGFALWESQTGGSFPATLDVPFLTDDYTVQAGDAGNWVTLPFTNFSGNSVTGDASFADSSLYAGIQIDGSTLGGKRLRIFDDITTFQASTSGMIYLAGTLNSFYTNGNAFFIRLNMKRTSTGVKENVAKGLRVNQNQPNPAKGVTRVNYELENASNVSIQVTDITGKVVFSESYGVKASGRNSIELNTSNLDAGVYFYTLKADEASITKKMSVIK